MDIVSPLYFNEKANYIKKELAEAAPLFKWEVEASVRYLQVFTVTGSIIVSNIPFYLRCELPLEALERYDNWLDRTIHELAYTMANELLRWKKPIT